MASSRIRAAGRALAAVGVTVTRVSLAEADALRHAPVERRAAYERHARGWARSMLRVAGVRVHVSPPPHPANGPRLVVAAHRTTFDSLVVLSLFGGHILSRGDVSAWPLIGRAARSIGVVFVDRESRKSGARAIRTVRRLLREGNTVTVFPEGTTHRGDEVRPFLPGAFVAVRGLDVDVLPVGLAYPPGSEWEGERLGSHAGRVMGARRTDAVARIGEPLRLGSTPAAQAAERVREEVQRLTHAARTELEARARR